MFSKIIELERLLTRLSAALEYTDKKRYTANQALRAENISLAEGATLNIQMNNTILSVDIVHECLEIVGGLKCILPMKSGTTLDQMLNHYADFMVTRALKDSRYRQSDAALLLGITERQLRYRISKNPQLAARPDDSGQNERG